MRLTRRKSQFSAGKRLVAAAAPPLPVAFELELQQSFSDAYRRVHGPVLDHPHVHTARDVRDSVAAHPTAIEVCYLPSYSPERNPEEYLNGDPIVATAILDRLLHHRHDITIRSENYRRNEKRRAGLLTASKQLDQSTTHSPQGGNS